MSKSHALNYQLKISLNEFILVYVKEEGELKINRIQSVNILKQH